MAEGVTVLSIIVNNSVHTTGVNWDLIAALVTIFLPVLTGLIWLIRREAKGWQHSLGVRIDSQDRSIDDIINDAKADRAANVETAKGVARVEGFLAASNGLVRKLPEVQYPTPVIDSADRVRKEET